MSTTVDQRVVEMKFDNQQFESGVRESMSTLDKLKQALNFNKTATGLENISKEVAKVDMSGLASATEEVSKKFSALEVIAITTLVNITNSAVNAGKSLIKSMSIDQLTAGWTKFEQKTTAVQTILSATRMQFDDEAKQLAVVNAKLKELNWFTDETSYNFTDMVSNIGKFTSAGVDLDTAAKSMQGIATWAAMSGANAVTASRAMYNLAQAIGVGYVKLIDWKTIENCNMATMEFKQTVLETAVELGTLKKEADGVYKTVAKGTKVTAEAFSESLSEGWFTNNVLTASLNVYEKATDKLHEMADKYNLTATEILGAFDDYKESAENIDAITEGFKLSGEAAKDFAADLDILNSEEYELSISAFKAAQQAKTFTDVIDATKDAVSTGWMQTFEYIFGNYHEAVELFSDLCEVFWELFASGAEARNEMLELWHDLGGREALLDGIYKAFENIGTAIDFVKEAWNNFFGKDPWQKAAGLIKVSNYIKALFEWLEPTTRELENIKDIFIGLYSVVDLFGTILKTILKTLFPMINPARSLFDIVLEIGGALGRLLLKMTQFAKESIESSKVLDYLGKGLQLFVSIIMFVLSSFVKFLDNINIFSKSSKVLTVVINGLATVFKVLGSAVIFAISGIVAFVKLIGTIAATIVSSFKKLVKSGVNGFKAAIIVAKEALLSFIDALKNIPILKSIFDRLGSVISSIKDKLKGLTSTDGKLTSFFNGFGNLIKSVGKTLGNFIALLIETVKRINPVRIILLGFVAAVTLAIYRFSNAFKGIPKLITSTTELFDALKNRIAKPRIIKVSLLQIAASIAILTASLYVLANKIDPNRLWECVGVVTVLSGLLLVLAIASSKLNKSMMAFSRGMSNINSLGIGLLTLSSSILVLTLAMKMLNEVETDGIWERLAVLATISAGLVAISITLSKLAPRLSKDALILVAFALSVSSMVNSLKKLADLDKSPEELQSIVSSLTVLMVGLSALAFAAKGIGLFSAVGLIALVLSFKMVLPMLEEITKYHYADINNAIKDNLALILTLTLLASGISLVGSLLGKKGNNFGKGLLMMAAAVAILVQVMKSAQELDPAKFKVASAAMLECLVLIGVLEVLSKYTAKAKPVAFAASLIFISIAVSILAGISKDLGEIDKGNLITGVLAVSTLLGMVAILEKFSEYSRNIKGVAKVLIGVSIIAAEMAMISLIPWRDIIPASIAMGIAMVSFGYAIELAMHRKWNLKGIQGILAVAASTVLIGAALSVISRYNWKSIIFASLGLSIAITRFGEVLETVSKSTGFNDSGRAIKKISAVIAVSLAMSLLGLSMAQLAKNDWASIGLSLLAMMICLKTFNESLTLLSGISSKNIEGYKGLIAMAASLFAMAITLKLVANINWPGIGKSFIAMIEVLGYLWASVKIINNYDEIDSSAWKNILAISAILLALGGFLKLISEIPWETIAMGSLGIMGALATLTLVLLALKKFTGLSINIAKDTTKVLNKATVGEMYAAANVIASMALAIASIGLTFKMVYDSISSSGRNLKKIGIVFVGISGAIVALGFAAKVAGTVGEGTAYNPVAFANILSMSVALLSIGIAFSLLTSVEWYSLIAPFIAITVVLAEFAGLITLIGEFSTTVAVGINGLKTMFPFAAMLLSIGLALMLISTIDWDYITVGLTTIGAVIGMLVLVVFAMKHINPGDVKIASIVLTLSGMMLAMGISLRLLAGLEWDDISTGFEAMLGTLAMLTICTIAIANLAKDAANVSLMAVVLTGPMLACALAMKLLSTIPDDKMGPAFWTLFGIAVIISAMTLILSKVAPVATVSFPAIAGALVGFALTLAVCGFLNWDNIWYGFSTMLKIAGIMGAIVAGFTILGVAAPGIMAALLSMVSTLLSIGGILVMIAGGFSVAALIFNTSILILAGAFKLLETVDWYALGDGIQAAVGPLALLAATMFIFTMASLGNLTLLAVAGSMLMLNKVDWNTLSIGISKTYPALLGLLNAIKEASLLNTITLMLTSNALKGMSVIDLNTLGDGLDKVSDGIYSLAHATEDYNSSGASITDISNQLLNASNNIVNVATVYEQSANRVALANTKMILSSTLLGSFLGQGLVQGLLGSSELVYNTSGQLADTSIQGFADTAVIHSPSRRMMEMGSYLMQGLSVGAMSEAPNTYNTMGAISDNTIRAASVDNSKMYQAGKDSIKSQNKGMIDEARTGNAIRVISAVNDATMRISGQQLKAGNYQNGIKAEAAKTQGHMAAAPQTAKAINQMDQAIGENEVETYETYGEMAGTASASGTVEGSNAAMPNVMSAFGAFGSQSGMSWWDGFKNIVGKFFAGFQDFAADIVGMFDAEMAEEMRDAADEMRNWGTETAEAAGITSVLDTALQDLQDTMKEFKPFDFDNYGMVEVRYGDTLEWQKAYDEALEAHNYAELDHLNKEKNAMWEVSMWSDTYMNAQNKAMETSFDFEEYLNNLTKGLDNFGGGAGAAGEEVDEFTQKIQDLHSNIESQIDAWNEFDRTIDITSEDLIKNLQSQISGVNEWSNKLLVLAQRGISQGILEELANMGPQGFKYVEAFIQMTGDELATVNDLWLEKGTLSTSSTLAIQAAYALAGDEASKAYVEGLGVNLEQIQNAAQQLGDSLAIEATPEALRAIDAYKEEFKSLYDSIESSINIFEKFNMETETSSEEILENMKSQIEGVTKWSENLRILGERGISDGLLKELSALGPDGYDKVNAFVEMSQAQLEEANELYAQSLELPSDATANVLSGYAQAGDESAKAFIEALGASVSDVDQIGTYILQGLELGLFDAEATQSLTTTAYNVGDSIIQQLYQATDSHSPSEEARKIGVYVDQGLRNGLKEASALPKEEAFHMGDMIISGLRQGIENGRSGIIESMVNTARSAIEAAKAALDIHSPSRVFAEIGRYVDEGFAQGINQNAQAVADSAENMSYSSIDIVKNAIEHARDLINGDIDNTITLTPVLDLTNVRAGVQQINGMMNASSVSANVTGEDSDSTGKNQNGGMTFIQNNYSPKALNRIDIYRQTKNQFAAMKGLVSGT